MTYRRYPAAHLARLHLVPGHVRLRDGLVVDVGANVGDWTLEVSRALPGARVLALEPVPALYERLKQRTRHLPTVRTVRAAAHRESGSVTFHLTQSDLFGSLLEPHAFGVSAYGDSIRKRGDIVVPARSLDELVGGDRVSLLKIDVQGADLPVLAGAKRALAQTQAVLIEANFVPQYEGGSTFAEIHDALTGEGFRLWNWQNDPARAPDGSILWTDACYARADDPGA